MKGGVIAAALLLVLPLPGFGQTMLEGKNYDFKPATYSTAAPPTLGPDKAKGLVIWSHGRGETAAAEQAPPLALYFAQQGWDVYSLYRGWGSDDRTRAQQIVQAGVANAQTMGYGRIILMGQSAGAYASIDAARYGAAVEAVIALAPAAHGGGSTPGNAWRQNDFAMRGIWENYASVKAKVTVAYFTDDDYYEAHAPNVRGPWVARKLKELGVPHFVISQPGVANLTGHGAGQTWNFARRFGPCIYAFVETGAVPPCDDDGAAMPTFRIALPAEFPRREGDPYAGLWQGTWSHGRFTLIGFGDTGAADPKGLYRSGLSVAQEKPENYPLALKREGWGLSWPLGRFIYEARPAAEGTLAVVRYDPAKPNEKATATLRRID
jgi:hypothetical protein